MYCIFFDAGLYYKVRCKLHLTYLRRAHFVRMEHLPHN